MTDHDLERRFQDFNVSTRARNFVAATYGTLRAAAEDVKLRERHPCHPSVGGFYVVGGVRDALDFARFRSDRKGCGEQTALDIATALLMLGATTFEECFPQRDYLQLAKRLRFNDRLASLGWTGPFLDGPKRDGRNPAETKEIKLRQRRKRLAAQLAKVERELDALRNTPNPV